MPNNSESFQSVSPVLLSSPFTLLENNSAIPNSGFMSYPFRKAIVIEEIRWSLQVTSSGAQPNLGALVYTKLSLGRHFLMRDKVPIWLLGTAMAVSQEEISDNTLTTPTAYSHYRWRLPEPLYVAAGQVLSSTFFRGVDGFGTMTGEVTYVGRTVAPNQPVPKVLAVPYVAPFITNQTSYQQSNEAHLFNPFDIPIRIQRLTGRVTVTSAWLYSPTPVVPGSAITILMNDSWGGKMVNNNTGPSDVFDTVRAAWTVDTIMPPKGVYEIKVWNIPSIAYSVHVAMIGVREERL